MQPVTATARGGIVFPTALGVDIGLGVEVGRGALELVELHGVLRPNRLDPPGPPAPRQRKRVTLSGPGPYRITLRRSDNRFEVAVTEGNTTTSFTYRLPTPMPGADDPFTLPCLHARKGRVTFRDWRRDGRATSSGYASGGK